RTSQEMPLPDQTLPSAAAGGWLVDPVPGGQSEIYRPGNEGERNLMDRLTARELEVGHHPGHERDYGGVTGETLITGMRRTPKSGFDQLDPTLLGATWTSPFAE